LVSGKPPRRSVYATSRVTAVRRRYLNTFRGEPAISGFAWHFTPTLRSSLRFAIQMGSGLHARVPHASPCPRVDHPVSGRLPATCRPFGLAFAPAPAVPALTSRRTTTRRLILQKARRHSRPLARTPLRPAGSARFQALFHSPRRGAFHRSLTVLVPYRSLRVFSLGSWSTRFPTRFRVSDGTHVNAAPPPTPDRLRDSHPLRSTVPVSFGSHVCGGRGRGTVLPASRSTPTQQRVPAHPLTRFGLLPFRSPLLRESSLFLAVLRCFSSRGLPTPIADVSPRCRGGVAPFGYPWITRCQHVPRAFRGVAASFIGSRRLGIHRALIIVDSHPADPPDTPLSRRRRDPAPCFGLHASCPAETGVLSGGVAGIRTPDLRRARAALSQLSYDPVAASAQPRPSVGAPGLEPGTSVLSGPRSHHLSYAPAARPRGRRRRSEATTHLRSIPHPPAPPGRPQTGP